MPYVEMLAQQIQDRLASLDKRIADAYDEIDSAREERKLIVAALAALGVRTDVDPPVEEDPPRLKEESQAGLSQDDDPTGRAQWAHELRLPPPHVAVEEESVLETEPSSPSIEEIPEEPSPSAPILDTDGLPPHVAAFVSRRGTGKLPRVVPTTEANVRDFILMFKDKPFAVYHFIEAFNLSPKSKASVRSALRPFVERGVIESLPRREWIKPPRRRAKPQETWRYVRPEPSKGPRPESGPDPLTMALRTASPPPAPPVVKGNALALAGSKQSRMKLPEGAAKFLEGCRPRPTVERSGSHFKIQSPGMTTCILTSTPSDRNFLYEVRRKMRRAGYETP